MICETETGVSGFQSLSLVCSALPFDAFVEDVMIAIFCHVQPMKHLFLCCDFVACFPSVLPDLNDFSIVVSNVILRSLLRWVLLVLLLCYCFKILCICGSFKPRYESAKHAAAI